MYPEELEHYADWLYSLKRNLAIVDDYRDDDLLEYISIAHRNIWTQYYLFKLLPNGRIPLDHDYSFDIITKRAVLHLAATYFSNPDEDKHAKDLVNSNIIVKLLGARFKYG